MNHRPVREQLLNTILMSAGFLVFVIFCFVTVLGNDGLLKLAKLYEKKDQIIQTNHELLMQNFEYLSEIHKLKEVRFVEQTARSDFGLVRPDEVVFVVE